MALAAILGPCWLVSPRPSCPMLPGLQSRQTRPTPGLQSRWTQPTPGLHLQGPAQCLPVCPCLPVCICSVPPCPSQSALPLSAHLSLLCPCLHLLCVRSAHLPVCIHSAPVWLPAYSLPPLPFSLLCPVCLSQCGMSGIRPLRGYCHFRVWFLCPFVLLRSIFSSSFCAWMPWSRPPFLCAIASAYIWVLPSY